jgi:hypothetical protein
MPFLEAQHGLSHAYGARSDFHQRVFPYETDGLLQGHVFDGGEEHVIVFPGCAHVGEFLFFGGVHTNILASVVFSDDHPLIDRFTGGDQESAAGLQVKEGIEHRMA